MERPTREINEYLDLQVAGIQKAAAALDRGEGFRMSRSKSGQFLEQQKGAAGS